MDECTLKAAYPKGGSTDARIRFWPEQQSGVHRVDFIGSTYRSDASTDLSSLKELHRTLGEYIAEQEKKTAGASTPGTGS